MIEDSPVTISEREWDGGLWRMVLASGALHVVGIALLLLIPHAFVHRPPPLVSYTVDLVAPDKVGGTNLVPGGKGRIEAAPLAAEPPAPKVEPPKPPPPKMEEAKPPEPKAEPEKAKEVASKSEPKPPPPEAKPKEDEAVLAEKVKKVEPPPPPTAMKAAPSPKLVAKVEPPKPQPPAQPKVDAEAAKKAAAEAAAHDRDQRIMAAIKKVEQKLGARGGGTGPKAAEQPGGPVSVGPGEGAGGKVMGLEYLLYYGALDTRLKQSWAWAGATTLEAIVHFSITDTGEILDVRIIHTSGDLSYDASVVRAVKAVNPLPPPPEAYRKEFANVEWTFNAESREH